MEKDNIIKFRRPETGNKIEPRDQSDNESDEVLNPVVLIELLEFLTALRTGKPFNRPLDRNIELRRQGIKDSSDGWLFARVNRSTELDWRRQPTFYDAVIAELMERGKIDKKK
jgi:hypothetical protein